jgi:hypothetical protein
LGALAFVCALGGLVIPAQPAGAATKTTYSFSAVDCISAKDCIAVGGATRSGGGAPKTTTTLVLRWDGTTWSNMHGVNRAIARNVLTEVSCTAADFCMAAGYSAKAATNAPKQLLVERWNGKRWSIVPSEVQLAQISCSTKKLCMALSGRGFARWDGSKWAHVAPPPGNPAHGYQAVACADATRCVATSSADTDVYSSKIVAARWNGSHWSNATVTKPNVNLAAGFFDAACASKKNCMTVGAGTNGLYSNVPFAWRWNGNAWSRTGPASPSAIFSQLEDVSCTGATSCFASGIYYSGPGPAGYPHPFVDQWNGTTWSVSAAPDVYGGMKDISCVSATSCLALGYTQADPDISISQNLALYYDGTSWTSVPIPNPS